MSDRVNEQVKHRSSGLFSALRSLKSETNLDRRLKRLSSYEPRTSCIEEKENFPAQAHWTKTPLKFPYSRLLVSAGSISLEHLPIGEPVPHLATIHLAAKFPDSYLPVSLAQSLPKTLPRGSIRSFASTRPHLDPKSLKRSAAPPQFRGYSSGNLPLPGKAMKFEEQELNQISRNLPSSQQHVSNMRLVENVVVLTVESSPQLSAFQRSLKDFNYSAILKQESYFGLDEVRVV